MFLLLSGSCRNCFLVCIILYHSRNRPSRQQDSVWDVILSAADYGFLPLRGLTILPAESRSRGRSMRGAARGPRCCRCAPRIRLSTRRQQAAVSLFGSAAAVPVHGQIAGDFADKAHQRVRPLGRDAVPHPQVRIVYTLLRIQPVRQNVGRRFLYGGAVLPVQFGNSLLRTREKQADDFAVFHRVTSFPSHPLTRKPGRNLTPVSIFFSAPNDQPEGWKLRS